MKNGYEKIVSGNAIQRRDVWSSASRDVEVELNRYPYKGIVKFISVIKGVMPLIMSSRRRRAYTRMLSYDPKQDYVLSFTDPAVSTVSVNCDGEGLVVPAVTSGVTSAILELQISATAHGELSDPGIEMTFADFRDWQYFERGARGTRFLNLSRLLAVIGTNGGKAHLQGKNVVWRGETARLHMFNEKMSQQDRVMVVAPHPDDAEIAAFGLYSDTNATVVTLTAGNRSMRYRGYERSGIKLAPSVVGKMRVLDSLTIPRGGDVDFARAVNLCFPDGRLHEMHSYPDRDFRGVDQVDFDALRRLNHSPLLKHSEAACSWRLLISDLSDIIKQTNPTVIVMPHPQLDPHPDHIFASAAVGEAMSDGADCRVFFYCVHNRRSELWPFGPQGAGVPLVPILAEDDVCLSSFYSHPLSEDRQLQKFLALEAMHDIRQLEGLGGEPLVPALRRLVHEFRGLAHGMGAVPTDYLRRAVRPDEIFFVTSPANASSLTQRALAGIQSNTN
jgi:hypothetical protein